MSDDRERVRAANPIEDIVSEHVELRPAGRNLKGLCPFHREKTPSFTVDPARGTYRCFGCQENGDVFSFVMKVESLEFREALERLAERANITLEKQSGGGSRPAASKNRDYELLGRIAKWFRNQLATPAAEEARTYLAERGLDGEVAERFELGFAPDRWDALTNALSPTGQATRALELGVLRRNEEKNRIYDMFRGRIMFPIRDPAGRTVGFGGRCLPSATGAGGSPPPKYINSTDSDIFHKGRLLFGHFEGRDTIRRSRTLVVMEGYTDVMAAHREGFDTCVASLGTAFTDANVENLRRHADRVVFVFDGDRAGQRAARKAVELTLTESFDIGVVLLEGGADPADLLSSEGGRGAFAKLIEAPRTALDFLVEDCAQQHLDDTSNAQKRNRFARAVRDAIRTVTSEITRRRACELVAERLEVPASLIVSQFDQWDREEPSTVRPRARDHGDSTARSASKSRDPRERSGSLRNSPSEDRTPGVGEAHSTRPSVEERNVLRACLEWPEHLLRLLALREPHEFSDDRCRNLAEAMDETARPFRSLDLDDLDLRNLAIAIEESESPNPEWLRRWLHGNVVHRARRNADHLKRARELHGVFDAATDRRDYDQMLAQEIEIRAQADQVRSRPDLDLNSLLDAADTQIRVAEELRERFVRAPSEIESPADAPMGPHERLPNEPTAPIDAPYEAEWK